LRDAVDRTTPEKGVASTFLGGTNGLAYCAAFGNQIVSEAE
jgi:hypothetical protein